MALRSHGEHADHEGPGKWVKAPQGWAYLQLFYEKTPLPPPGSEEELPLLLYVAERGNQYLRLLTAFGTMLAGPKAAEGLEEIFSEILHLSDMEEIEGRLDMRQKVFDAWSEVDPFKVMRLPTREDMERLAAQKVRAAHSRFVNTDLSTLTDSVMELHEG